MILGKVVGTVVSTKSNTGISGGRFLLIDKCNHKGEKRGDFLIALDILGAGKEELVMISESTSARETPQTINKAIDAVITGIIDVIDENETVVYRK
jgi:microcompartment protein CcmK/EutM